MTADAEGGAPEVTLETSMGPFTVEVLLSLSLCLSLPFLFSYYFVPLFNFILFGDGQLYYKHAPRTCRNFLELSRRGYYDNVKFHRIIKVL